MSQSRREKKYLQEFKALDLDDKRKDYAFAIEFLAALLGGRTLPRRTRARPKIVKRRD